MTKSIRPWIVLSSLSIFILYLGHAWGEREGLLWAVCFALVLNGLFYFYGDLFLKSLFQGSLLEGQDAWSLKPTLHRLAARARVREPELVLLPLDAAQAFAVARNPYHSRIYLTEGLLRKLTPEEVEAILAFELALIKRQDTFSMSIASLFLTVIFSMSSSLDWVYRWLMGFRSAHNRRHRIFSVFLAPLAASLLRINLRSRDFFEADALGSQWIGNPKYLAQALWKLESLKSTSPWTPPLSTAHFFVVNPLTAHQLTRYLHVHPPLQERVKKLVGYYPL